MAANKVETWLAKAGQAVLKVLGFATQLAEEVEPIVDLAVPEVAAIYNNTVTLAAATEAALGGGGTGAQKLAALTVAAENYAKQQGWQATSQAALDKWASAFADTLNNFPFVPATPAAKS